MCLRRAPEKYIAGAALDRAGLDNWLTNGGKFVSLTHRPRSTPQKRYVSASGSIRGWVNTQGLVRLEGFGKLKKKIIHVIVSRNRDLPACNVVL
jgi:hypothetical protein